jgi:hypothetical protein
MEAAASHGVRVRKGLHPFQVHAELMRAMKRQQQAGEGVGQIEVDRRLLFGGAEAGLAGRPRFEGETRWMAAGEAAENGSQEAVRHQKELPVIGEPEAVIARRLPVVEEPEEGSLFRFESPHVRQDHQDVRSQRESLAGGEPGDEPFPRPAADHARAAARAVVIASARRCLFRQPLNRWSVSEITVLVTRQRSSSKNRRRYSALRSEASSLSAIR